MATRDDAKRLAVRDIIREEVGRDPDHVQRAIANVVQRLKTQGRHSETQIEAAALDLYRKLGIPPRVH